MKKTILGFLLAGALNLQAGLAIIDIQYNLPAHTATLAIEATEPWELWKGVDHFLSSSSGAITVYTEWMRLTKPMGPGCFVFVDANSHPKQNEHYELRPLSHRSFPK